MISYYWIESIENTNTAFYLVVITVGLRPMQECIVWLSSLEYCVGCDSRKPWATFLSLYTPIAERGESYEVFVLRFLAAEV